MKTPNIKAAIIYDDVTYETCIRVNVRSDRRNGLWGHLDVPATATHLRKRIEYSGAALAEHMNTRYGDKFDPSEVAKLALEASTEVLAKMINSNLKTTERADETGTRP